LDSPHLFSIPKKICSRKIRGIGLKNFGLGNGLKEFGLPTSPNMPNMPNYEQHV